MGLHLNIIFEHHPRLEEFSLGLQRLAKGEEGGGVGQPEEEVGGDRLLLQI